MRRVAAALAAAAILFSCVPLDGIESKEEIQMTRPTSLPEWASSPPVGAIVEPSAGKKQAGHAPAERPPAQHENWWKNLAYQWLAYFDTELHGSQTIIIPFGGSGATRSDGSTLDYHEGSGGVTGAFGGDVFLAIGPYLPVGSRITGIRVIVDDSTGNVLTASARKHAHQVGSASPGGAVAIGSSPSSDQSGNVQSLVVLSGGSETVVAGTNYLVKVTSSGAGPMQIIAVEIDYDRPAL